MSLVGDYYYQQYGQENEETILFLHGFLGTHEDWQEVIFFLCKRFRCIAVDLPGHGRSKMRRKLEGISGVAGDMIGLMDALQVSQVCVTGYSMGGRIALYLLLNYADRFYAGVLESVSPGLEDQNERDQRNAHDERIARQLENEDFRFFLQHWYKQPLFALPEKSPQFKRMVEKRAESVDPAQCAASLRSLGLGRQPSLWASLPSLDLPVSLLVGEKDSKFVRIAEKMCGLSPRLRMLTFTQCGHNIHFQEPENMASAINEFIKKERVAFQPTYS
jgi:2-succinyl-6-hydroxy-2,4-cyclohexadiene-1-carboxylate synthase